MMKLRNTLLVIPIMTFFVNIAILLDIPILREIIAFVFLSFMPGFAILKLFRLKNISFVDTVLFSVALSIAFVMFDGLLVNELYLFAGLAQPLTIIPLTLSLSAFTLTAFLFQLSRRDLPDASDQKSLEGKLKRFFPLSMILFILPLISALSVLYFNIDALLLSCAVIAALCVMSPVFRRLFPEELFPFLIFSISMALVLQFLLTSNHILGYDANLEYYVFKLTQINGHWGSLSANVNSGVTLTYGSMLSITILPAVYSALMGAQGEIVFKMLYPFIFCLVPIALFRINENQFGKLIGLFSALFFTFTFVAFFSPEPLSLNRQIVGEFFLLLSVFLLTSNVIPVTKRRLLLIIFGAALAVSHYSLAYIYLAILTIAFVISKAKPRLNDTLNSLTLALLFVITFSWYALATVSPLLSMTDTIKNVFAQLIQGFTPNINTASSMYTVPTVFTITTWINLLLTGISYIFLITGVLLVILKPKITGVSPQFRVLLTIVAFFLAISVVVPNIASILNFTRIFTICLLFLSACFVLGGQALLTTIEKVCKKIKPTLKNPFSSKSRNINIVLLLIAIILGAYFLSQVGFINRVGNGTNYFYSMYFKDMASSNDSQYKFYFYGIYIPEQDIFSACWLASHKVGTAEVLADTISGFHVLLSYGLVPNELLLSLANTTYPPQGSFIYLGSLNVVNGIIAYNNRSFNASRIDFLLDQEDIIYSNGNSEIYCLPSA